MRFLYTDEMKEWLLANSRGKWAADIVVEFNAAFGLNKTKNQIKAALKNFGIKTAVKQTTTDWPFTHNLLTQEETDTLKREFHENKNGSYLLVQKFIKEQFNKDLTLHQVKRILATRKIRFGHYGKFTKGHKPVNTGKKVSAEIYEKLRNTGTWFPKGHKPHNYMPVGSERIIDGYLSVKIADPDVWKPKHRIIWEDMTGEILGPEDKILFCDGNALNLDVDNLAKVSQAELAQLNKFHKISEFSEITKANIVIIKLKNIIKKRGKEA